MDKDNLNAILQNGLAKINKNVICLLDNYFEPKCNKLYVILILSIIAIYFGVEWTKRFNCWVQFLLNILIILFVIYSALYLYKT